MFRHSMRHLSLLSLLVWVFILLLSLPSESAAEGTPLRVRFSGKLYFVPTGDPGRHGDLLAFGISKDDEVYLQVDEFHTASKAQSELSVLPRYAPAQTESAYHQWGDISPAPDRGAYSETRPACRIFLPNEWPARSCLSRSRRRGNYIRAGPKTKKLPLVRVASAWEGGLLARSQTRPRWPRSQGKKPCSTLRQKFHSVKEGTMAVKPGWEGRCYEDFEIGDVYRCRLGRTVTETDNTWFTLLTCNTNQIHFNTEYGKQTEFGQCLINSGLTLAIVAGLGVADVSENGFNLGWDNITLPNPVFAGDTLYSESEVLEKRESKSKPQWGIIKVETRGVKQDGTLVCQYTRNVMVWKKAHVPKRDLFPELKTD